MVSNYFISNKRQRWSFFKYILPSVQVFPLFPLSQIQSPEIESQTGLWTSEQLQAKEQLRPLKVAGQSAIIQWRKQIFRFFWFLMDIYSSHIQFPCTDSLILILNHKLNDSSVILIHWTTKQSYSNKTYF